jgi:hypothetical protein
VVAEPDSDVGTWWMGLIRAAWRQDRAEVLRLDVEAQLDAADSLREQLALALFDDVSKTGEVGRTLERRLDGADRVVRALNEGAHGEYDGDLERLTRDAERLAGLLGAHS